MASCGHDRAFRHSSLEQSKRNSFRNELQTNAKEIKDEMDMNKGCVPEYVTWYLQWKGNFTNGTDTTSLWGERKWKLFPNFHDCETR
jgi:hypothetical protein